MPLASAILALCLVPPGSIDRADYGVPVIHAPDAASAYYWMGRACSQDRLWQMEMSRRSAEGRLAEVLGRPALASDQSTLSRAYTRTELEAQFGALPSDIQESFKAYTQGVNDDIAERRAGNSLPAGYAKEGFEPEEWTTYDSASILVMLSRIFGTGGAGELRALTLYSYLGTQKVKGHELDVIDDIAFPVDLSSPTTVDKAEETPDASREIFPPWTRQDTFRQIGFAKIPGLFELLGALGASTYEDNRLEAESLAVPFQEGSYAMVVGKDRSATGNALLLSAPQMGHSTPSIIHETTIDAPGLRVAGMDIPGVPLVAIGSTPDAAWGLTSGVADIEDIFVSPYKDGKVDRGGTVEPLQEIGFRVKVKGGEPVKVTQRRTSLGPVLLFSKAAGAVYSLHSSYWGRELSGMASLRAMYTAKSAADVDKAAQDIPVTFNLFFAFTTGDIGYRYVGWMPKRAPGLDPRFPTPDLPQNQWRGFLPYSKMPRVTNPKSGLLTNWNNKSVSWWPNGDTPVWGTPFRVQAVREALPAGPLRPDDLERAAWTIARKDDDTMGVFLAPLRNALDEAKDFSAPAMVARAANGWLMDGSAEAAFQLAFTRNLRKELFLPALSNMGSQDLFDQALPAGRMVAALAGKTKYDYRAGRTQRRILLDAFMATCKQLGPDVSSWTFHPGSIKVPGRDPIPYINRGTFIQICEMGLLPSVRDVASPGVAETGEHSADQVDLARAWIFKPVYRWRN